MSYIFYAADSPGRLDEDLASDSTSKKQGNLTVYWGTIPDLIRNTNVAPTTSATSNIHPVDYAGPSACRECHQENYDNWSRHPHRWMNALATDEVVVGDFSDSASIQYKGGIATFYRENGAYHMRYQRDDLVRAYQINQTIGSRFFQYYVGTGLEGPEAKDHDYYHQDHVLPFGYWIDRKAWVPIVHVQEELPDDQRWDPTFSLAKSTTNLRRDSPHALAPGKARGATSFAEDNLEMRYATACNFCHTTFPLGDMFARFTDTAGQQIPEPMYFSLSTYLADSHPELWDGSRDVYSMNNEQVVHLVEAMLHYEAPQKAVTLGISCEACHLGCKAHAEERLATPSFIAHSPHLLASEDRLPIAQGATHGNVNWVCSRCHNGDRPTYAAGISTWNSTEFSDASRGACYSQLTCIHCHNPHQATGKKWSKAPAHDDASCLSCHIQYDDPTARQKHTHHPPESSGDHCMNCHMPKINEGMQDVVRTHTIFSPTQKDMIEANHPNACNLCHLDKPIDWTLDYLKSWYGKRYSQDQIAKNYPHRDQPVGFGWLKHSYPAVRLVAADALAHSSNDWAVPDLIDLLDDEYLLNRQFTQKGLEDRFGIKLDEASGYWFYMTRDERRQPIERLREELLESQRPEPKQ